MEYTTETLSETLEICVNRTHRFGTDAFLLSDFANIRRRDVACDLCSGCGIVALLWFRAPGDAPQKAYCVEVQPQAAQLLCLTVERAGLEGRVFPLLHDLRTLEDSAIPAGSCDLVTCNPPYKAEDSGIPSVQKEALLARHEVLCTLGDVCARAARLLRYGGRLCLCQRPERLPDVFAAMRSNGIEPKRLRMVQKNGASAPWLALVEGKRGAKPFLQVEPPLLVQGERDGFSPELKRIYRLK